MAKTDFPFSGSFGGFSFYKMKGSDKVIVRGKTGPSAEKVKTGAEFTGTRKQQKQFGGCSTTARSIRDSMRSIEHLKDYRLHSHINKLNMAIADMDTENDRGKRSLIFSKGLHLFEGLSLNRNITLDAVVTTPIVYSLNRAGHSATLQLPALSPGLNFTNPWGHPFYRFRMNLGVVRDMIFVQGRGYEPITPDFNEQTIEFDTEWALFKIPCASQQIEMQLDNPVFDEHCHLMLSIGIEFGIQANGSIQHFPGAGCGKILAMG